MAYFNEFPHTRTYDSDLGWLIKTVTEINKEMQSFVQFQKDIEKGFEELSVKVEGWDKEIKDFETRITVQIEQQNANIERQFLQIKADIAAEISAYLADLSSQIAAVRAYAEAENLLTKSYVDAKIAELMASIPDLTTVNVHNPVRNGQLTSIQTVIDDLYDLVARAEAITAAEYDSAGLTAAEYDALNLSAYDYDTMASRFIAGSVDPSNLNYMFSPISGTWMPVRSVVLELARFHLTGITAAAYDALNLTAEAYDAKNMTALDFDRSGVTP